MGGGSGDDGGSGEDGEGGEDGDGEGGDREQEGHLHSGW